MIIFSFFLTFFYFFYSVSFMILVVAIQSRTPNESCVVHIDCFALLLCFISFSFVFFFFLFGSGVCDCSRWFFYFYFCIIELVSLSIYSTRFPSSLSVSFFRLYLWESDGRQTMETKQKEYRAVFAPTTLDAVLLRCFFSSRVQYSRLFRR